MKKSDTCRHGRRGIACAYCLSYIRATDYWEMVRLLNERRKRRGT